MTMGSVCNNAKKRDKKERTKEGEERIKYGLGEEVNNKAKGGVREEKWRFLR